MRYFGLASWLEVVSRVSNLDIATLMARHVDLDRAIVALRAGGGPPEHDDVLDDVAAACYRLLLNFILLRPYAGDGADRAVLASITAYARKRGCELSLGTGCMQFIKEVTANTIGQGGLGKEESIRSLRCGLRLTANPSAPAFSLEGYTIAISAAVSDPTPSLAPVSDDLVSMVDAFGRRHGAVVSRPYPQHRKSSRYGQILLPQLGKRRRRVTTASTADIFTRSINRITDCQVHIIVMDPRSTGSSVEREWSLRTRKPIYELQLADAVHPHSDAPPFVTPIRVDLTNPEMAAQELFGYLKLRYWELADSLAASHAEALKNGEVLRSLQVHWKELNGQQRDHLSGALRMSRPYIEGMLSNPSALELASHAQRLGLTTSFGVPDRHPAAAPTALSEHEQKLLTEAALEIGLDGLRLVRTVQLAGAEWRRAYAYARLTTPAEARESVSRARNILDETTDEDDWESAD